MVLPKNPSQTGKTVRFVYAFAVVIFISIIVTLLFHQKASALLPLSNLPIIGQPVANTVNALTDRVVTPATNAVTGLLPAPLDRVVQSPVDTVTQAVRPIVGPTSPSNSAPQPITPTTPSMQNPSSPTSAATNTPPQSSNAMSVRSDRSNAQGARSASLPPERISEQINAPPLFTGFTRLQLKNNYSLLSQNLTRNFAKSDDFIPVSGTISAIIAIMVLLFASFIAMIYYYNHRALANEELALSSKDIVQSSMIVASVLITGSITLFAALY